MPKKTEAQQRPKKTEAQQRAQKKYMQDIARVEITMRPEKRQRLQEHALLHDKSVNRFINRAIDETMERDESEFNKNSTTIEKVEL